MILSETAFPAARSQGSALGDGPGKEQPSRGVGLQGSGISSDHEILYLRIQNKHSLCTANAQVPRGVECYPLE